MRIRTHSSLIAAIVVVGSISSVAFASVPPRVTTDAELEAAHRRGAESAVNRFRQRPVPDRRTHHHATRSKALALEERTTAMEVTIVALADEEVLFHAVDPATLPEGARVPVSRATSTPGVSTMLLRKVGERVTLHFARDASGAAYVTRVTRPGTITARGAAAR